MMDLNSDNAGHYRSQHWLVAAATWGLLMAAAAPAVTAPPLLVANNGVDSGTCGLSPNPPCRSLGQAIANASAGDNIVVGPGHYGDLNGDGTLGNSPGEEVPSFGTLMISVDKQLTITSRDGAGATVLDAAGSAGITVVGILSTASGAVFGKAKKGFTVRNGLNGLTVDSFATVSGNLAEANSVHGFVAEGFTPSVVFKANAAINNGDAGFALGGSGTVVKGNVSRNNGYGFYAYGSGALITKNVFSANGTGGKVAVVEPGTSAPVAVFSHNAVVGNDLVGVEVDMNGDFTTDVSLTLDRNDYFGNGNGNGTNCGLLLYVNDTDATPHTLTVTSIGDYWGAGGGPGGDPADDAGTTNPACSVAASGTINLSVVAPSSKETKVSPPSIR